MIRRAIDVLAHVVAIAALLVLGVGPTRRVLVAPGTVILATSGTPAAALRRVVDSTAAPVVRIPDDEPDAAAFARHRRAATAIVTGWGLDEAALAELARTAVVPGPATPTPGVTYLSWRATLPLGEALVVAGAASVGQGWARLRGPGGVADSATVDAHGRFRLVDVPRAPGRHLYALAVDGAAPETLGVSVTEPARPRALLLAAAPSFEVRAWRDWLASRGAAVAVRTAVSRQRWQTDFVNRPPTTLAPLRDRALTQFDVVLTDARTLAGLASAERAALERAVRDSGIGLIVQGTGGGTGWPALIAGFAASTLPDLGERSVRLTLDGVPPSRVAVAAEPLALTDGFAVETVVRDGAGVGIVQVAPRGAGTVALSLVDATSRWLRAGEPEMYAAFWSRLLQRVTPARAAWRAEDGPHRVGGPVELTGPGVADAALVVTAPSGAVDTVYATPDPLAPSRARAAYWPREAGWHAVGDAAFHVRGAGAWAGLEATERRAATTRASVRAQRLEAAPEPPREERRPWPLGWAFALFVVATGYLWAARR